MTARAGSAWWAAALILSLVAACGPTAPRNQPNGDGGPDPGSDLRPFADGLTEVTDARDAVTAFEASPAPPDTGGDGDALPADAMARLIWTTDGRAIDVSCSGVHEGAMRFRASRDQLSEHQLQLLSQLSLTDARSACVPDLFGCTISITGGDGGISTYVTFAGDQICGNPDNVVGAATFAPFRASLPCSYGFEGVAGTPALPPMLPDERCLNGLRRLGNFPDRFLAVADPGVVHHVELDRCGVLDPGGQLAVQIFAPGATVPLAEGAPVADGGLDQTCLRIDHAFAADGTYLMKVSTPPGATTPPVSLFFRFY